MNDTPGPDMKVLLFYAVLSDSEIFSPSKLKVKTRNPEIKSYLEKTRLLNCRQRGKALYLSANDATWRWVEGHFEDELPRKIEPAFRLMNALRGKLARYLAVSDLRLSDVFAPEPDSVPIPEGVPAQTPTDQVRQAYLDLSHGQFDVRVRLRDLRPKLEALNRAQQDETLLEIQRDGWLVLYSNDDPQDRDSDDEAAAIILGDRHRDLVYLHREQRQ